MSDFEDRLRDALGSGADEAPDVHGLAHAARSRARARRRTTTSVVAAVAIVAIAVPVGAFALRDSGPDHSDVPVVDASDSSAPDGFRTESWRDLEIEVPDSWGYGALTTWCIGNDKPGKPVVQRPGGAVEDIACTPSSGYGVEFLSLAAGNAASDLGHPEQFVGTTPGDRPYPEGVWLQIERTTSGDQSYPEGAWVGIQGTLGGDGVLVVAPTEEIAQRVLDSARHIDGVDSNGCAPEAADAPDSGDADTMSVCRYAADGWLQQSELLTGQDAEDAVAALQAAPKTFYAPPCPMPPGGDQPPTEYAVLIASDATYTVQWTGSTCPYHGVFVGDDIRRQLTADVMYWALSPGWSGGVDGDVPLPPELRQ